MNKVSARGYEKIILLILSFLIFIISSLFLLGEIYDPDFFWHIKTGEWIWQHKALPEEDPFAHTSPGRHSTRERFILTSFWLSQAAYHLFYLAGGLSGIVFLRFLMAGALLYALWKRKHGDDVVYLALVMIFLTFFLQQYPIERPQVFSFLFFAVLLCLLERIKETGGRWEGVSRGGALVPVVPALMLLWANMHPGFIIGQAAMALYVVTEGLKFLFPSFRPMEARAYKRLCLAAGTGVGFSLVNPNSFYVWKEYLEYKTIVERWNFDAGYLTTLNPDYMSSLQFFALYNNYSEILYWLVIALAMAALAGDWKKVDITDLALLTATGVASFFTARYSFFFMAAALPVIARYFSRKKLLKVSRFAIPAIALFAGIFFSWGERNNLNSFRGGIKVDDYNCPVKAADFIISNDLRGNMYNVYEWGGYLIWRLAPERKVFTDPRDIFGDVGREASLINSAVTKEISGIPIWKGILQARSIEYIVIPIAAKTGAVVPLFSALMQDKDWLPVFADINAIIFVKDSPVNGHVIGKYAIPKDYLMNALIGLYDRLTAQNPYEWSLFITRGDFYFSRGNFGRAGESYARALEIAPFNVTAKERLGLLRRVNHG
jgi:hypothetical protein